MKIGIYYGFSYGLPGGIQQYTEKLIMALLKHTNHDVYVLSSPSFKVKFLDKIEINNRLEILLLNEQSNIRAVRLFFYFFKNFKRIENQLKKANVDVLHIPYQILPWFGFNIPCVISLHDLQQEYFPEFFSKRTLLIRKLYYKKSAMMSDHIIVSFNHVKNDIIKFYHIPSNKITVTSYGEENRFQNMELFDIKYLQKKFNIEKNYILYPANTWEHKNHITLLKALKYINEMHDMKINLVCTGAKTEFYKNIEFYINEYKLQDQVKFIGFVDTCELFSLYKNAKTTIIPTLYEAGSGPLFEAMSLGVPVICSNVTSLPEVIGNSDYTFDPLDYENMGRLIIKIIKEEDFKRQNIKDGERAIKRYNWSICIKNFEIAYENAINSHNCCNKSQT